MKFELDEAELRELAQIEEETNCDVSAGFDWGQNLGNYLSKATSAIDHEKLLGILQESLGNVLSQEELEDAARMIQEQLRERVIEKIQAIKSA